MKITRRDFVKKAAITSAAASLAPTLAQSQTKAPRKGRKLLNAYYFRAHMYTLVPKQVREDLKWMADIGTDVVSVAILEQDLRAAVENVAIIVEEAAKLGMDTYVVPSRWAGLLAGAPKVPSVFTVQNPEAWLVKENGKFYKDKNVGVHSSIHYAETVDFFKRSIDQIFKLWDIKGVIWDEPKIYDKPDYSPAARKAIANLSDINSHNAAFSNFFGKLNTHIKEKHPGKTTSLFAYANWRKPVIDSMGQIKDLDYFGCDGRPWPVDAGGQTEQEGKNLLGGPGAWYLDVAKANGKKGLLLIENHNMPAVNNALMDRYLSDVVALGADQLIYYYYPRNVDKPEENMAIIAKHLKNYK